MAVATHNTASDTLALLEERIRRIDYILHGDLARDPDRPSPTGSAVSRLRHLERSLQSLTTRSPAAADVLALQKAHPQLFHSTPAASSTLPTPALAALVLAHRDLITSCSTHLSQLSSTSLPDSAPLTKLVALEARIQQAQAKQEEQAREVAELRARSAKAVETWYEHGVLDMGEKWADWEERVRECEILVRRREAAKAREEGIV